MMYRGMTAAAVLAALLTGGCAETGALETASINQPAGAKAAAAIDPACASLSSQIDTLATEGSVARLEQAADGKGAVVRVKREAIAKQAELNKLNSDYRTKCGPKMAMAPTAAAPQAAKTAAAPAPTKAAAVPAATAQAAVQPVTH